MNSSRDIIFLCVANSARSQIAEGLARAGAPKGWSVYSAGSDPGRLHPLAAEVLAEVGIDIAGQHSKGLDAVPLRTAHLVITLCAEEACPVVPPGVRRLDWAMQDPALGAGGETNDLDAFRSTRDALSRKVSDLWSEIETGEL